MAETASAAATRLDATEITAFYDRVIAPQVISIEAARVRAVTHFCWRAGLAIGVNIALIYVLFSGLWARQTSPLPLWLQDQEMVTNIMLAEIFVVAMIAYFPLMAFRDDTKAKLLGDIVRLFPGLQYDSKGKIAGALLQKSKLFPDYDEDGGGDLITGTYKDVSIASANVVLIKERTGNRGKQRETVFRGPVYHLSFPRRFNGVTRVRRDGGWLGNKFGGLFNGLQRVTLEDPTFEKQFEVYSSDQIEARYILTTGFMELLLRVAARHNNWLEAAFFDQSVLLKVSGQAARLQIKNPLRRIDWRTEVFRLVDEFQDAFALADLLKLNQKIGL